MGGQTTGNSGSAGQEGGYGGTKDRNMDGSAEGKNAGQTRREQGYGGERDMDPEIGA